MGNEMVGYTDDGNVWMSFEYEHEGKQIKTYITWGAAFALQLGQAICGAAVQANEQLPIHKRQKIVKQDMGNIH
jgi:hypothetical protein